MRTLLFVLLVGCGADGGVLELALDLPAAGSTCGADRAAVRVVFESDVAGGGACPFTADWAAGDCLSDLPLSTERTTERVSIVASDEELGEPLCVRVAFGEGGCLVGAAPAGTANLRVERAFAEGRYTEVAIAIADPCANEDFGTREAMVIP